MDETPIFRALHSDRGYNVHRRPTNDRQAAEPVGHKGFSLFRWISALLLLLILADTLYLYLQWPNWSEIATEPIPKSNFMVEYEQQTAQGQQAPEIQWNPLPLNQIPPFLLKAVIVAEDSRFYQHTGIDTVAIKEALQHNLAYGKSLLGTNTITRQTVKNLFLGTSHNPLRKWHEIILALAMEKHLTKHRILELYFNTAEFGEGIYGIDAASHQYWGINASDLNYNQATKLAATLSNPRLDNPITNTQRFVQRVGDIAHRMSIRNRHQSDIETQK